MIYDSPDRVDVYRRLVTPRNQRWRWRRTHPNRNILAHSGEGYSDRAHAIAMARRCNVGCRIWVMGEPLQDASL